MGSTILRRGYRERVEQLRVAGQEKIRRTILNSQMVDRDGMSSKGARVAAFCDKVCSKRSCRSDESELW